MNKKNNSTLSKSRVCCSSILSSKSKSNKARLEPKTFIAIAICILFSSFAYSQTDSTNKSKVFDQVIQKADTALGLKTSPAKKKKIPSDSIESAFIRDSMALITPKLVRTEFRLDSRASSFQGAEVNIYGYYAGVMIKSKLSLGLAYYRLSTNLPAKTIINGINAGTSLVVNCGSLNSELIYYNSRYISLGFPLEIAAGQYKLTNTATDGNQVISQQKKLLAFANFGLSGTFKPFQFIGLKLMVGYRKSIYPDEKTFNFNGVYTSLGLAVDFSDFLNNIKMYKLMKRHNKIKSPLSTGVDLFTD